ncbi:MAG: ArsA-related P-loop ATPase, partial [Acidimicrobiales bacterium]|nr:ArsA-related P-loop ATPase [Acidimicrobiales bacterium]
MDARTFCCQSRVVVVAGKGGVGKTTVTAAMARMAAGLGLSVLIVEVEGKTGLAAAFGAEDLEYDERELAPNIRARSLTSDVALVEYLEEHGLRRLSKRLVKAGLVEVVSTAVPGIKDILVLGKVKQLERAGVADLILLDAPAAGHAVSFLM